MKDYKTCSLPCIPGRQAGGLHEDQSFGTFVEGQEALRSFGVRCVFSWHHFPGVAGIATSQIR